MSGVRKDLQRSPIDPNTIRWKAHQAIRGDGLDTLIAGTVLAIMAIFFVDIRHGWALGLGTALYLIIPDALRTRLTLPRAGVARPPGARRPAGHIIRSCAVIVFLAAFYLLGMNAHFGWMMPLFLGIVFALVDFTRARRNGGRAGWLVTSLFLVSGLVGTAFAARGYDPGLVVAVQLWGLAALFIPWGLIGLRRFLRRYPRPDAEVSHIG